MAPLRASLPTYIARAERREPRPDEWHESHHNLRQFIRRETEAGYIKNLEARGAVGEAMALLLIDQSYCSVYREGYANPKYNHDIYVYGGGAVKTAPIEVKMTRRGNTLPQDTTRILPVYLTLRAIANARQVPGMTRELKTEWKDYNERKQATVSALIRGMLGEHDQGAATPNELALAREMRIDLNQQVDRFAKRSAVRGLRQVA